MNVSAKKKCRPEQKVRPALKWRSHIFYRQDSHTPLYSAVCVVYYIRYGTENINDKK